MNDSISSLESMMKEISAMKFDDDFSSDSEEKKISTPAKDLDDEKYSIPKSSNSFKKITGQSVDNDNASIKKFCKSISQITNKKVDNLDDALSIFKSKAITSDNSIFISNFNARYQTSIQDLTDIFGVIDDMKKNFMLNYSENNKTNIVDEPAQSKLMRFKAQIETLTEQNKALEQAKSSYEKAFNNAEELLDNQIEETKKLANQRNQLVQYLQVMDVICREIDNAGHLLKMEQKKYQPPPQEKIVITQPEKPKINSDDSYQLLAATYRTIETNLHPTFMDELQLIRDSSSNTTNDRIVTLVKCIVNHYSEDLKNIEELEKQIQSQQAEIENTKKQCNDILVHFEDELRFLQKLSHSRDLQNVMFYRPANGCPIGFDNSEKEELIRKCVEIGKFIDENIGKILLENVELQLNGFDTLDGNGIFTLLQPYNSEKKIAMIVREASDDTSFETRKLIDLLVAQVIMNNILTSHTYDLHTRITVLNNQIKKLDTDEQPSTEFQQQIDELQKENKLLVKHEKTLRRKLTKIVKCDDSESTLSIVQKLINSLKKSKRKYKNILANISKVEAAQTIQEPRSEQIPQQISPSKLEKKKLAEPLFTLKQGYPNVQNEQIRQLENRINELNNQINEQKAIIQKSGEDFQKSQENIDQLLKQKESMQKNENELKAKASKYASLIEKYKKDISALKHKLEETIHHLKKTNSYAKKMEIANSKLGEENEQLVKRIKHLEELNAKGVEAIKSKSQTLRTQFEATVSELQKIRDENLKTQQTNLKLQADTDKIKAENDELKIQNKALQLKIKTNEEKFELERKTYQSQISANTTSAQADLDHLAKENEEKMKDLKNQILDITLRYNDCIDPFEAVKKLSQQVEDLRKVQSVYASLIEDAQSLQRLLNIEPGIKITPYVEKMKNKLMETEKQLSNQKRNMDIAQADKQKMSRDLLKNQSQIASNIQWETWARRILRVITDNDSSQANSNKLRQNIEEILFNSISNKGSICKLDILRQEKRLFKKYDSRLLNVKSNSKLSLNHLIIAVCAANKIQRLSGYTPLLTASLPISNHNPNKYLDI